MVVYLESRQDDGEEERVFMGRRDPEKNVGEARQMAEEQWNRAAAVLSARPALLTPKVLHLVLKNRPPSHVVQFLLSINPRVADIPKTGPTALHVAIRHRASLAVIRIVVEACPLALVATHDGYDAVMYAKHWRPDDPGLLQLLSKPLSTWMSRAARIDHRAIQSSTVLVVPRTKPPPAQTVTSPIANPPSSSVDTSPVILGEDNKKEFDNIKKIASAILRAQKRQTRDMEQHRQHVETGLQNYRMWNAQERTNQLHELEKLQIDHFRTQLIALDMKERAMVAKVRSMERRVVRAMELSKEVRSHREARQQATIDRLETTLKTFYTLMSEHQAKAEQRMAAVEVRLEQECKMNDYFRSDTRLQLDQFEQHRVLDTQEARKVNSHIVFATPFNKDGDDDTLDTEPLFSVPSYGRVRRRKYPRRSKRRPLSLFQF